jgi:hypothetical protein
MCAQKDYDTDDYTSDEENENVIESDVKTFQLRSFYDQYLKNNKINLSPEYQRDFCWNEDRQNLFIDSIMKNYIVPMFIIIKNDKKNKYEYDCIDGQHRFRVIKNYIEGNKITNNHTHWKYSESVDGKKSNYKVYYEKNEDITSKHYNHKKFMSNRQKETFNNFNITVCIIKTELSFSQITEIFFRLQNGERVSGSTTFLNLEHPICGLMRKENFSRKSTYNSDWGLQFKNLIVIPENNVKSAVIRLSINTFLILMRDAIDNDFGSTYLPLNIIKSIQYNQGMNDENCQEKMTRANIFKTYDEIFVNIKTFFNKINNLVNMLDIKLELPLLYILYYIYLHEKKYDNIYEFLFENCIDEFNNIKKYITERGKIVDKDKLKSVYSEIINKYKNNKKSEKDSEVEILKSKDKKYYIKNNKLYKINKDKSVGDFIGKYINGAVIQNIE